MRYVWVGDDIGYMREDPRDDASRRYYQSHNLKSEMLKEIEDSNMKESAKMFSTFAVKSAYLEQILNEYFENAVVLCGHSNPIANLKTPSADQKRIWTNKNGDAKLFSKLSLGQKHQVIQNINFIIDEDSKKYKKILAKLDTYVQLRNAIVHDLFSPKLSTEGKLNKISEAVKLGDEIAEYIDKLDTLFGHYILRNLTHYYAK